MKVELDERYGECCKENKNWIVDYGEVVCTKCGKVLTDKISLVALA